MLTTSLDLHCFGLTAPTRRFLRSRMDHSVTRTAYKILGNIGPIVLFSPLCGEILDNSKGGKIYLGSGFRHFRSLSLVLLIQATDTVRHCGGRLVAETVHTLLGWKKRGREQGSGRAFQTMLSLTYLLRLVLPPKIGPASQKYAASWGPSLPHM